MSVRWSTVLRCHVLFCGCLEIYACKFSRGNINVMSSERRTAAIAWQLLENCRVPFQDPFPTHWALRWHHTSCPLAIKSLPWTCCFYLGFRAQNFAINVAFKMHQFLTPAMLVCGLLSAWCSILRGSWGSLSITVCSAVDVGKPSCYKTPA